MKNLFKLSNGKWRFEKQLNGKIHRKTFLTKADAVAYITNFTNAIKFDLSFMTNLSRSQVKDIKDTLDILPNGISLKTIVDDYIKRNLVSDVSMQDAWDLYIEHLIALKGFQPKLRMHHFITHFKNWNKVSENNLLDWLMRRGMPKTIKEYYSEIKRFYAFAKRRKFIEIAPIDNISQCDFPKIKRSNVHIWSVADVKLFFQFLKEKRPRYLNWFAIACFAGIRRAEINRLKPEFIDLKNKTILLPYDITKTGDTWLMEDLPNNLWVWLKEYGTNIQKLPNSTFTRLVLAWEEWTNAKGLKKTWEHNICRHSFCTYHLSLYRDPAKTSLLLKHREPNTMWQHYLAGLIDKNEAKKYFEIVP